MHQSEVKGDVTPADVTSAQHVQYRCTQMYESREEDFQIDVVTEEYFPEFVELLASDTYKTVTRMKRHHKQIRELLSERDENERKHRKGLAGAM